MKGAEIVQPYMEAGATWWVEYEASREGFEEYRERGSNSFIENLKSLFTGQAAATTNSADDWMKIGVPEQDAHNYQSEIDAGRSIVLIRAVGNAEQALSILRQSEASYQTSPRMVYKSWQRH